MAFAFAIAECEWSQKVFVMIITGSDHCLLNHFLQSRRGHAVLRASLPDKDEHVILVKMSPIQRQLYSAFINTLKEENMEGWVNTNPLKAFAVCCKVKTQSCVSVRLDFSIFVGLNYNYFAKESWEKAYFLCSLRSLKNFERF